MDLVSLADVRALIGASAERDAGKVHVAARRGSAETGCYRRRADGAMALQMVLMLLEKLEYRL
jgi:hypothetical protein